MKFYLKKCFGGLLALAILMSACLTGCVKNEGASQGGKNVDMGRYAESLLATLPNAERILHTQLGPDGELAFYACERDKDTYVTYNVLKQDGTLETSKPEWINSLLNGGSYPMSYSESADGTGYLLYSDGDGISRLARSKDGKTDELELEGWIRETGDYMAAAGGGEFTVDGSSSDSAEIEDANSGFAYSAFGGMDDSLYPMAVAALDNGEFLVSYMDPGVYHYNADGEKLREYLAYSSGRTLPVFENRLMLLDISSMEYICFDLGNGSEISRFKSDADPFYSLMSMDGGENYLLDSEGIHRLLEDGGLETLVDGGLTSLILPAYSFEGFAKGGNGEYYCFLSDGDGISLMGYTYDEALPSSPDKELNIFSLYDSNTLRQAIGEFQRLNPDVRVNLNVALGDDSGSATAEDVIRALNTELLGGKGPDLIVLDGMPIDSYIEKGVLEDISELITELTGAENLMENLVNAFNRGGKIYAVPARFSVPVMIGSRDALDKIGSLSDLARLTQQEQGMDPPLLAVPDELWSDEYGIMMKYYELCASRLIGEDGKINQDALAEFYSDMLALDTTLKEHSPQLGNEGMLTVAAAAGSSRGYEVLDLGAWSLRDGRARIHLQTVSGLLGLRNICDSLAELDASALLSSFEGNMYTPTCNIGVTASGGQKELAKQFVKTLLSGAVQDKYLYDGLPVNAGSLDRVLEESLGGDSPVPDMGFRELCGRLDTPVLTDEVVKGAVKAQIKGLIGGALTPEQAASNVSDSTRLYLAE